MSASAAQVNYVSLVGGLVNYRGKIMSFLTRLLAVLPRNATFPVIAVLAGWYGGAKYGAPDYVMSSIDDLVSRSGSAISGFLNQDDTNGNESSAGEGES